MGHGSNLMNTDKDVKGCANCGAERNPVSRSTLCDECLESFRVGGLSRIEKIMALIEEEAGERTGKDEVSILHGVLMEVSLAAGETMRRIREKEREHGKGTDSAAS